MNWSSVTDPPDCPESLVDNGKPSVNPSTFYDCRTPSYGPLRRMSRGLIGKSSGAVGRPLSRGNEGVRGDSGLNPRGSFRPRRRNPGLDEPRRARSALPRSRGRRVAIGRPCPARRASALEKTDVRLRQDRRAESQPSPDRAARPGPSGPGSPVTPHASQPTATRTRRTGRPSLARGSSSSFEHAQSVRTSRCETTASSPLRSR